MRRYSDGGTRIPSVVQHTLTLLRHSRPTGFWTTAIGSRMWNLTRREFDPWSLVPLEEGHDRCLLLPMIQPEARKRFSPVFFPHSKSHTRISHTALDLLTQMGSAGWHTNHDDWCPLRGGKFSNFPYNPFIQRLLFRGCCGLFFSESEQIHPMATWR